MPIWNQVAHNLLSETHLDTTAGTVTRGAIPTGQTATPTWQLLSLGATGTILRSNGTDILYSTATFPNTVVSGDILIATGTNAVGSLAVGAANTIVRSTGTAPAYSTATYPNTVTSGSVLFATGTNAIGENNANFFWDNTNSRLGLGTTAPNVRLSVSTNTAALQASFAGGTIVQVGGANATFTRFLVDGYAGQCALDFRRANTTAASPSALAINDPIGQISCFGFGATAYSTAARGIIRITAAEAWTDTANGTYMTFLTTKNTTTTTAEAMRIDNAGNVGIGTTTIGAQLTVATGIEIFQTATLTAGSVGSIVCPYDTATTETDAKGGNLNGCLVVNNADLKIYARTGGVWKGVAIAGFSIPNYSIKKIVDSQYVPSDGVDETVCPLCQKQMEPGQALGMLADKWYNNMDSREGLHALAAHLRCLMEKEKLVTAS